LCCKKLFPSNRRPTIAVTVLGDMKGLGVITQEAHKEVGSYAALNKVDYLYTTGELAMMISQAALEQGMSPNNVIHFEQKEKLFQALTNLSPGTTILVKGARKAKMEDVVNFLTARYGDALIYSQTNYRMANKKRSSTSSMY
jgi:UDP-N-acetylmuramoyl-tripeptide--D-alanyl-D-alanine ligase